MRCAGWSSSAIPTGWCWWTRTAARRSTGASTARRKPSWSTPRASCAGSTSGRSTRPRSSAACCRRWTRSGCRRERPRNRAAALAAGGAAAGAGRDGAGAGGARRHAAGIPGRGRGAPLPRPGRGTALRDVPEPVAGRFQRPDRARPAARSVRPDARGSQRRRDPRLPRRALRRIRAVPPALQRQDLGAVAGAGRAAAGRRAGGGADRACAQPPAAGGRGGPGMVSGALLLYVVLVLASLLVAALVALPLRRESPRLFVAVLLGVAVLASVLVGALVPLPLRRGAPPLFVAVMLVVPVMAFALSGIVGTPAALGPGAATAVAGDAPTMEEAIAELETALERDPAQPEGWRLLARAHASLGNRERARDAYLAALKQIPDDPELLLEAAQAQAQAAP